MADERNRAYTDAIIAIARGERALDAVEDELLRVARAMASDRDLHDALTNIHYPADQRIKALDRIIPAAHPATRSALAMLVAAERARDLEAIAQGVADAAAAERGRAVAEVRVAVPLDEQRKQQLREALERATGKQIELKVFVDPAVIGGVHARLGDTVIDGTVAAKLERIKSRLG